MTASDTNPDAVVRAGKLAAKSQRHISRRGGPVVREAEPTK